jgi:hypothetical protein
VVELTRLKNLEDSLNRMIGDLLHVSASLKTELQFIASTGHCSDGTAGLLPRAIELVEDCIGYAKSITDRSTRYFSADAPGLQLDSNKADRVALEKADTSVHGSGKEWWPILSQREHSIEAASRL